MIRTQFHAIPTKFLALSAAVAGLVIVPASVHAQSHPVGGGVKGGGFLGEYYNTATLPAVGTPPAFSRRDVRVEFTSSTTFKPGGTLRQAGFRDLTADNYSVRWSGELLTQFSETYTFKVTADDGARLYLRPVGGSWTTVIDAWNAPATTTGTYAMTRNTPYEVKLEYKETTGAAACVLKWSSPSTPEEVIEPVSVAGINAETHKDEWYTDCTKIARDEYSGPNYNDRSTWPARDANGWPRGDFSQIYWEGRPPTYTAGTYLLKFRGKARVEGSFGTANFTAGGTTYGQGQPLPSGAGYDAATNTTTAYAALLGSNIFSLSFSQTQRTATDALGTGVTEVQFYRPIQEGGNLPYDGTSEYRADSLALYAPFTTLRMLSANFVTHTSWVAHPDSWTDDSVPNGDNYVQNYYPRNTCRVGGLYAQQASFWQLRGFPAWERQVEMANLTGKDLYITINYKADADYVTKLAQLIRYGSDSINPYTSDQANPVFAPLNPNLKVYIEWSNEMWNFGFQQFFDLLTETRAILANPAHAYHPIVKYDNIDVAPRGDGGYNNEVVIMYRVLALKAKDAADTFRTVFGESGGPINRARGIFMWQYDNAASVVDALEMLDDWYNNADGITHVANPQPIKSYFWGGGGASYYNAVNGLGSQTAIAPANSTFSLPALTDGQSVQSPSGSSWTYTGTAGMNRSGSNQRAYISGTGEISQVVNFPAAGIYDFNFRLSGDGQQVDVYVNGRKVNSDYAPSDYPMSFNSGTPFGAGGEYTAFTMPFELTAPGSVTLRIVGLQAGKTAYIDNVAISSADVIYASGMPYYTANTSHERLMQIMVNYVKPYGLKNLIYEGGWSLSSDPSGGGSDASSPLGKYIKYNDQRSRVINRENGEQLQRAGGVLYCFGSFGQWSETLYAQNQPIWQSFNDLADQLPAVASNGFYLPTTVTAAVNSSQRDYYNERINGRGWVSWNMIVPSTGTYNFTVNTTGSGGQVALQIEGTTVATGASGTPLTYTATSLTAGMQSLNVRSMNSTGFAVTSVVITQPGAPSAPTLTASTLSGAGVALTWTAPASGSVDGYTIRYGLSPNTYSGEIVLGNVTSHTVTGLSHAKDYYFTVIARSGALNSVGSNERSIFYVDPGTPYWQILDDRDPSVSYSSGWSQFGDGREFKTTDTYTGTAGATATFTFTGTKARFISAHRSDYGLSEIYLDDVLLGVVDHSINSGFQVVSFETPTVPLGVHKLKVRVTGTRSATSSGNSVFVDAFAFYHPGRTADPAPAITSALSANATGGQAFSYTITGSNSPTAFSAIGLPPGLSLNTSTGLISGTPTASGSFTVFIGVANGGGSASGNLVITVATGGLSSAATPTISPNGGTFTAAQTVTLATSTSGSTIRYTLDGTTPTSSTGTLYSGPFTVDTIVALRAVAFKAGMLDSPPATANFVFSALPVATPVISPDAGSFSTPQTVTITCATAGASIRYTTDGSDPHAGSTLYSGSFTAGNPSNTIRARAFKDGMANSNIATATFYVVTETTTTPVISPATGTFTTSPLVSISSATAGASIRYTTDGSTPTSTVGTLYSAPFRISATSTIKAIAYKAFYLDSAVGSASLTVNLPTAATPAITPNGGTYTEVQSITITSSSPNTTIRYTTDGSTPTVTTGTVYTAPFDYFAPTGTIKAVAYGLDFGVSAVASAAFTINLPPAAAPVIAPGGGTVNGPQTILLSSATPDAIIRYTLDGSNPSTTVGTVYSGPFTLVASATVKAVAYATTRPASPVTSAAFTINYAVSASHTLQESFSYTNGATLNNQSGGTGFSGNWLYSGSGNGSGVIAAALTPPTAFPYASTGLAARTPWSESNNYYRVLSSSAPDNRVNLGTNGVRYFSLLFRYNDTASGGYPTVYLTDSANAWNNQLGIFGIKYMFDGTQFTATVPGATQVLVGTASNTAVYYVVGKIVTSASGSDSISYKVYTGADSLDLAEPTAWTLSYAFASSSNFDRIRLSNNVYVDEIRFGPDWGSVTNQSTPTKAAAPAITPLSGNYPLPNVVTLATGTAGASIRYTTDGSTPSSTVGTLYSGPFSLNAGTTVKAIAYASGLTNSEVTTATYTSVGIETVAAPVISPNGGSHVTRQSVSISTTTPGASIRYTTDDTTPTSTTGTLYTAPFTLIANTTVKAIAYQAGWNDSAVSTAVFSINIPTVADPSFSPAAGTYTTVQNVEITSHSPGADIRYTTDGSTPTSTTGTPYTGPVTVGVNQTLKAIAYKTDWFDSTVVAAAYVIDLPAAATPVISPNGGSAVGSQVVTLSTASAGASIRYSTDGSTPTASVGSVYSGPITLTDSATVKAIAYGLNFLPSGVASADFTIQAVAPVISPNGGTHSGPQTVTLSSATPGATIRYTTDGSTPTAGQGTVYSGPFAQNSSGTVKAIAIKSGLTASAVTSADFTITDVTANTPTLLETFSYSLGELNNQNGGTGFAGAYANLNTQTVVAPLASPPAAFTYTPVGNAARFMSGNFSRPLAAENQINFAADSTRYFSFLFRGAPAAAAGSASTILQWSAFVGNSGSVANPTETAGTVNANLQASSATLSRGAGLNPTGNAAYGWNASNCFTAQREFWGSDLAFAQTNNAYAQATVTPMSGHAISLSTINFLAMSGQGTINGQLLYSLDGFATAGTSLGSFTGTGGGGTFNTINVSAVTGLQNQSSAVTFRWYFYGSTTYDVCGLGGSVGNANPSISFTGTVVPYPAPASSGNLGLKDAAGNRVNLIGLDIDTNPTSPAFTVGASGAGLTPGNASVTGADGNTTYFVAGRISTSASGQDSVAYKVYSGGAALDATTPASWTNSVNFTAGTTFNQLEFINSVQADEIRFAADWQAVTNQAPLPTQAAEPQITPTAGNYSPSVEVTITAPAGATIRYTTDGSTPTDTTGTVYSGPFTLTQSATVKAISTQAGLAASNVASAAFTLPVLDPFVQWLGSSGLPANTPKTDDSDNDGLNNLLEYALGGHPNSAASTPRPQAGRAGDFLTFSYFRARADVTYIVEGCDDLSTWLPVPQTPVAAGQTQVVTDTVNINTANRRFLRLRVTQP